MSPAAREDAVLPEIGKYHLVAELARGGMGNVYLAALLGPGGFNKLLVVKELKPDLSDDENVRLDVPGRGSSRRSPHPPEHRPDERGGVGGEASLHGDGVPRRSIATPHWPSTHGGGASLRGVALESDCEALRGLQYAHDLSDFDGEPLGIVHRDVSPLNVFVTFDGQAKVLDFGIAKTADSSLQTATGVLKGRVAYMAPEQAWGNKVEPPRRRLFRGGHDLGGRGWTTPVAEDVRGGDPRARSSRRPAVAPLRSPRRSAGARRDLRPRDGEELRRAVPVRRRAPPRSGSAHRLPRRCVEYARDRRDRESRLRRRATEDEHAHREDSHSNPRWPALRRDADVRSGDRGDE